MTHSTTSRLQKIIAARGYCSRRKAEELILTGKVFVEGNCIREMGKQFPENCKIMIDGVEVPELKNEVTLAINKIAGFECTKKVHKNSASKSIYELLPKKFAHLNYAGRLDKDSEGLLILTSNGELLQKLSHPSYGHKKTYEVTVKGEATDKNLLPLQSGKMKLDGKTLAPIKFEITRQNRGTSSITLILSEGRKREIRRLMDSLGLPVIHLRRTKIGNLELENLAPGNWKELSQEEISKALS